MEILKYKIIKTDAQYNRYCDAAETLVQVARKPMLLRMKLNC